jgi:hypothetical protein
MAKNAPWRKEGRLKEKGTQGRRTKLLRPVPWFGAVRQTSYAHALVPHGSEEATQKGKGSTRTFPLSSKRCLSGEIRRLAEAP